MRKILSICLILLFFCFSKTDACTNVIISRGASADGSCMISYAADSHVLYGELYFHPATRNAKGSMLEITDWDSYRKLGSIPQVPVTFQTVGNMNEHQLIIAETTYGGREELADSTGIMDYGSLIYITLQRARTAREAIRTIVDLANEYGYYSEGESFSIADTQEAWVMDLCGKGPDNKGIVWVARRVPDGYICSHANQARITTFPWDDPENCMYAPDVADFARSRGWYSGPDEKFSFRDAYCPLDFGGARACDARAWSAFNILCDGQFTYMENGVEVTRPATDWLKYAMGWELDGEMPLFVKPSSKISTKDVAEVMRDHYEGTPMDMTQDIGAGGNACPYRWRPMSFSSNGRTYLNERAIATQQTGFWFVAQARGYLPDEIGALMWFGCDDAATSYLTPVYVNIARTPECLRTGNGDMLHFSATSQFWACNRVTNNCYRMYNEMAPFVKTAVDDFENYNMQIAVPEMDSRMLKIYNGRSGRKPGRKCALRKVRKALTKFCVGTADRQQQAWCRLDETMLVKFIDGNVKSQEEDGSFTHSEYNAGTPAKIRNAGYNQRWKDAVARDAGETLIKK